MPAPGPTVSSIAIRISFPSAMPTTRNIPKNSSEFDGRAETGLVADLRRHQRRCPDRDRHRDQIGQYRHRATQQPGLEAGDHGKQPIRYRPRHRSGSWTTFACLGCEFGKPGCWSTNRVRDLPPVVRPAAEQPAVFDLFDVSKEIVLVTVLVTLSTSLRGAKLTKQSILPSRLHGLLRFARNDGFAQ